MEMIRVPHRKEIRKNVHRDVEKMKREGDAFSYGRPYQWRLNADSTIYLRRQPSTYPAAVGEEIGFEIDLVPKTHTGGGGKNRRNEVPADELPVWVKSFLARNAGMDILTVTISASPYHHFRTGIRVCGRARVNDPGLFKNAMVNGIGDAKTFGYGMLIPTT
jgi:hypothetical protein